jgi:prevent-host-death family protein
VKNQRITPVPELPATLGASEFKSRCLELFDTVRETGQEYLVTKHGEPIARVIPVDRSARPLRGMLRGKIEFDGDIVHVDWSDEWEATR